MILSVLLAVGSYLWSILWKKTAIAAAQGQEQKLSFSSLKTLFPTIHEIGILIVLSVISLGPIALGVLLVNLSTLVSTIVFSGILIAVGVLVCMLPGLYIAFRLSFSSYVFLEKKYTIRQSLKSSWLMTRQSSAWTIVWVMLVVGVLYIGGAAFFGIGLLITYPLGALLMAKLYRALSEYYTQTEVSEQHDVPSAPPTSEHEAELLTS
jgi:uncharacterized membrane protein